MRAQWLKFQSLSSTEKKALIQSLLLLPMLAIGLHCLGFRRCQTVLAGLSRRKPSSCNGSLQLAKSIAHMVRVAATYGPYHATCLPQAMTVWLLLRSRGMSGDLRIGVRKVSSGLDAHAWVEYEGYILNALEDIQVLFTPFDRRLDP